MVHPVAEADDRSPFGRLSPEDFYRRHSVDHATSSFVNPAGLRIFTQCWSPADTAADDVRGVVAVVHGFTGESSWMVQLTAVHFARAGFSVCALDHQGHGFSGGVPAHIPAIGPLVDDCAAFFDSFRARHPAELPCFLYGESLGGAVALLLHLRQPSVWNRGGLVLNGAMCGISAKLKPPWPLELLLSFAAALVPTRGSIVDVAFKVPWKRRLALASPRRTVARLRAATAQELLHVCRELQARFEEVTAPLLVVHGGEDVVCDPACAEELHRRASSEDKTLRVYPGMWHQLIGEPKDNVELVFADTLDWLCSRAPSSQPISVSTAKKN